MSRYYDLLKEHIIDFDKLLIEKYNVLGLDEVELVILLKLNKIINDNKKFELELLTRTMAVSEDIIRNKLVSLINNQFITLELVDRVEAYSIDDTYMRLAELLEKNDEATSDADLTNDIKKIVSFIEKEFNKILSPLELELVFKWFNDDKFSYDKIYGAVLESLKYKKTNLKYVDSILNKKETTTKTPKNEGLQDLFNQVYGKIK